MAMRRISREEFWLELEKRGCHRVSDEDDLWSIWLGLIVALAPLAGRGQGEGQASEAEGLAVAGQGPKLR